MMGGKNMVQYIETRRPKKLREKVEAKEEEKPASTGQQKGQGVPIRSKRLL